MKDLFKKLIILILIFSPQGLLNTKAASFTTTLSGPGNITAGQEFDVTVGVSGAPMIYTLEGNLNYDSNKLELISGSSVGLNGFSLTVGTRIVADSLDGKSGSFGIARLRFKAKTSFVVTESTTISVTGVSSSIITSDIRD